MERKIKPIPTLEKKLTKPASNMSRAPLSLTMSLYHPGTDQQVHFPTSSSPPLARFRKQSYTSNVIGNHLSLPDKLELLDSVRNRRSTIESITPQMTPFGSPSGTPRSDRNSFSLQAGTLSSLTFIEEEKLDHSKKTSDIEFNRLVDVDIETCMTIEHAERRRRSRGSVNPTAIKDHHTCIDNASMMESVIRTNTSSPFNDSLTSKTNTNSIAHQDSLDINRHEEKSSSLNIHRRMSADSHLAAILAKDKPRRVRLSLDSSPLFGRTATPLVVPSASPRAIVDFAELDTQVNIRFFYIPNQLIMTYFYPIRYSPLT